MKNVLNDFQRQIITYIGINNQAGVREVLSTTHTHTHTHYQVHTRGAEKEQDKPHPDNLLLSFLVLSFSWASASRASMLERFGSELG